MKVKPYEHRVQYYETDQMKVVHHSNYIRWFEEARTDYLDQIGMPYQDMEKNGILCPVLEASARYLRMLRFGDTAEIELFVKEYNGIKLVIDYQVSNKKTGMVHCKGETSHCFLTELGKPISLKRSYPQYHEKLMQNIENDEEYTEDNRPQEQPAAEELTGKTPEERDAKEVHSEEQHLQKQPEDQKKEEE